MTEITPGASVIFSLNGLSVVGIYVGPLATGDKHIVRYQGQRHFVNDSNIGLKTWGKCEPPPTTSPLEKGGLRGILKERKKMKKNKRVKMALGMPCKKCGRVITKENVVYVGPNKEFVSGECIECKRKRVNNLRAAKNEGKPKRKYTRKSQPVVITKAEIQFTDGERATFASPRHSRAGGNPTPSPPSPVPDTPATVKKMHAAVDRTAKIAKEIVELGEGNIEKMRGVVAMVTTFLGL